MFQKIKPDVVHSHLFDDSLPALLAARLARVKVRVITKQDTTFHYYHAPQYVTFDRFNNWNATHIHAVADENRKFIIEKEKAPEHKVYLIRNGFPYKKMTASKEEYTHEFKTKYQLESKFVIGTVARLIEWKGHKLIINAVKQLVKPYPNLKFLWAGTGDENYISELKKMIDESELGETIVIMDWIERYKMPSLYKCMDMYLHPAINEPFGFAISEALMNQVPIAATKTGSTDLIEHKANGYILRENSVKDIIESIEFLLCKSRKKETNRNIWPRTCSKTPYF